MKINTKSWHFRFMKFCYEHRAYDTRSLCQYVKNLVGGMALIAALAIFAAGAFACFITPVVALLPHFYVHHEDFTLIFGVAMWFGVALWALIEAVGKLRQKMARTIRVAKPDNLIIQYIKAAHSKICPIIEFED